MMQKILVTFFLLTLCSMGGTVEKSWALTEAEFINHLKSLEKYRAFREQKNAPSFSEEEYKKAFAGETFAKLVPFGPSGEQMAVGLSIMNLPAYKVWSLVVDRSNYDEFFPDLKEAVIVKKDGTTFSAFHFAKIPFPFIDNRQWVIDCVPNSKIHQESKGQIWEYFWNENPKQKELITAAAENKVISKVSKKAVRKAVTAPKIRGAWIIIPLPDGRTLAEITVLNDPGGSLPKKVVKWFSKGQAADMMDSIEDIIKNKWDVLFAGKDREKIVAPDGSIVLPIELATKK